MPGFVPATAHRRYALRRVGFSGAVLALLLAGTAPTLFAQVERIDAGAVQRIDASAGGSGGVTGGTAGRFTLWSGTSTVTSDAGATFTGTGATFQTLFPAGTAAAPSYSFSGDSGVGMFLYATGAGMLAASGGYRILWDAGRVAVYPGGVGHLFTATTQALPSGLTRTWSSDPVDASLTPDLGLARAFPRGIKLSDGSTGGGIAIVGGGSKALTDATPTIFATVVVASGSTWSGDLVYKLEGRDATDFVAISGRVTVEAINKAGTITCVLSAVRETASLGTGGATSTNTGFTCADAGSNVLNILSNYTTSLTDSAGYPKISARFDSVDTATITFP